jgi:hypothetical protein
MRAEADYGMTDMAHSNSRFHGDETLLVRFYKHPRRDIARSEAEGRPIFAEVDYIEIMQPGNKDSIIRRPASPRDKQRFAEHYRKYQAREDQEAVEGTPLEEWPAISRAQVEELKFLNIRTVEQLAGLSDSNAQNVMGIQGLKAKANKFLETADKEATAEKFAELEAKYEALLAAQTQDAGEQAPRRRGRPKKTEEAPAEE